MADGEVVRELAAKLGLDVDASAWTVADKLVGLLKGGLAGIAVVASAAGVALAGAVGATAKAAGNLDDMSARAGVAAGILQQVAYGAKLSGVSMEELAIGLNFASKKGVKDLPAFLLTTAERIKQLADSGRGSEAVALAIAKFGRSGARLVPFLKEGKGRIKELMQEAEALGFVMGDELIKDGDAFGDNLDRLMMGLTGVRNAIAGPLLRPLADLVDGWVKWLAVNRKVIALKITAVLTSIGRGLKAVWSVLSPVVDLLGALARAWKVVAVVAGSLVLANLLLVAGAAATAAGGFLAMSAAAIASGIAAAGAWLVAVLPIILLGALIAAVILIVEDLWTSMNGGEGIVNDLLGRWTVFSDSILRQAAGEWWIIGQFKEALRTLTDLWGFWIKVEDRWSRMDLKGFLTQPGFDRPLFTGGAASPEASAALQASAMPPAAGSRTSSAQIGPITIVQNKGENSEDFSQRIAHDLELLWDRKMGETAGALGPVP